MERIKKLKQLEREFIKKVFMAGFHYARNTKDDYDDENCFEDYYKREFIKPPKEEG